jgi:uncharacterized delta-60 repeat protein
VPLPNSPRPADRTGVPTPDPVRRDVLRGGAIAGAAGLTSLVLPAAAAHASPSIGPDGGGATTFGFDILVSAIARHDVSGIDGLVLSGAYSADTDGFPSRLTRIVPTDLFDTAFDTRTSALMAGHRANSIAVQSDGAIVAVGTRSDSSSALVVRLAADGTPDTTFNSNVPTIAGGQFNQAWDVLVRTDGANAGKILVAGDFTTATPPGGSALARNALLQLNADGTLDTGFAPDWTRTYTPGATNGPLGRTLLVLPDGDIILGGSNLRDGGTPPPNLLRVAGTTGALQRDLSGGSVGGTVTRAVLLSDGSVLAFTDSSPAGLILRFDVDPTSGGPITPELAQVNLGGQMRSLVPDGTDAFIIGGAFTTVAGTARSRLARITITGLGPGGAPTLTLDPTFTTPVDNVVWTIVRRRDGSLAIGGWFTEVDGQARARFARLSATGVLL